MKSQCHIASCGFSVKVVDGSEAYGLAGNHQIGDIQTVFSCVFVCNNTGIHFARLRSVKDIQTGVLIPPGAQRFLSLIFDFEACILGQSYVKYKNPGKTRYDISGLNNIMYNVGMEASLHGGGIYVDYSLNPVFRTGTGNDGHILSIGCMFGF